MDYRKTLGEHGNEPGDKRIIIQVTQHGEKVFVQRLRLYGKRIQIVIGRYPKITLAEAKELALENAKLVRIGLDPRVVRKLQDTPTTLKGPECPTFADATEMFISKVSREGRLNGSTEKDYRNIMRRHAFPMLGHVRVDEIKHTDIVQMLAPIRNSKQPTADKLLGCTRRIMRWCMAQGYRDDNPVNESIEAILPRERHIGQRRPSVQYEQVAAVLQTIQNSSAGDSPRLALKFMILTAGRSTHVLQAHWSEIDLEQAVWTVPYSRTKSGRPLRVPLSSGAMSVLREASRNRTPDSEFVFPSRSGGAMGGSSLSALCRRLELPVVPQGFRTAFFTWCMHAGVPQEIAESALGQQPSTLWHSHFRTDFLKQRHLLLQAWADYIEGRLPDNWMWYSTHAA